MTSPVQAIGRRVSFIKFRIGLGTACNFHESFFVVVISEFVAMKLKLYIYWRECPCILTTFPPLCHIQTSFELLTDFQSTRRLPNY